ncbi:MAG TPA: TonB family protein [Burkholderiales bacterium]|nr:TonB family protein [Burkholderiales bacterium]
MPWTLIACIVLCLAHAISEAADWHGGTASGPRLAPQQIAQAATSAPAGTLAADAELQRWRQRIRDSIQAQMGALPEVPSDAQVELEVSLLPSGLAADVTTRKTSGYPSLDAAARRAILAATPLPLPADPETYAQLRRFAVLYAPRSGVHIFDAHPLSEALPPHPAAGQEHDRLACRVEALRSTEAPNCQHARSRGELLTCFAQAVKNRTIEVAGVCGDVYPIEARKRNLEGTTQIGVIYDREGKLSAVSVAESSGQPLLDQRALELVRQAVLPVPAELQATPFAVRIPVVFRMQRTEPSGTTLPARPARSATGAKTHPRAQAKPKSSLAHQKAGASKSSAKSKRSTSIASKAKKTKKKVRSTQT